MQILKRALHILAHFYMVASLHTGLAVVALYVVAQAHLGQSWTVERAVHIGAGTVIAYNGLRYGALLWRKKSSPLFWTIRALMLVLLLLWGVMVYRQNNTPILNWILGMAAVALYPWLRRWGVLKIFWVSGVVTFTTVFLGSSVPVEQTRLHAVAWIHFVYICAMMLPFEIYDSAHDPAELRTLPQRIGIPWTKRFGYFLGVVFVVLVFLNHDLHKLWAAISIAVLTVGAIYKTQPHQSKTFTAFWVEALPMVWAGLVYGFGG